MIVLITPTGARQDQFKLCARFMKRQTYSGDVIWIIIDDAHPKTTDNVQEDFREKWTVLKLYPTPRWTGQNTQARNIKAGIDFVKKNIPYHLIEAIFIIEDDDYYRDIYLERMMANKKTYFAFGEVKTIYYNVQWRRYNHNNNLQHSSLFQTAFTTDIIPVFETCFGHKFIDAAFWMKAPNKNLFFENYLAIGIKGMPGRGGIGAGHKLSMATNVDIQLKYLNKLIGKKDADLYIKFYRDRGVMSNSGDILTKKRY